MLRCDKTSKLNTNKYQQLVKENKKVNGIVTNAISDYLHTIENESSINGNTYLFTSPGNHTQTKVYLVSGDKVKIIQYFSDNLWVNIGCINQGNAPIVAWAKADSLIK